MNPSPFFPLVRVVISMSGCGLGRGFLVELEVAETREWWEVEERGRRVMRVARGASESDS
jgi:hypothetical protein